MNALLCKSVQKFISVCCDNFQYCDLGVSFRFVNNKGHEDCFVIRDVELADFLTYPSDEFSDKAFRKVLSFIMPHFSNAGSYYYVILLGRDNVILYLPSHLYHNFVDILDNE